MSSLRVLLVEDDPGVRRFFEMVCADLPVALQCARSAREALAAFHAQRPDLLITDLMLPGEHGLWLVEQVRALPQAPADAPLRVVIFSADTSRQTAQAIERAGVWRILRKPASVAEIEACVEAALGARNASPAPAAPPPDPGAAALGAQGDPVQAHFGGNRALFEAFAASTRARFPTDQREGAVALQQGDAAALERLAHSLKTVLRMLGDTAGSLRAAELEGLARGLIDTGQTDPVYVLTTLDAAWAALAAALAAQARFG